MVAEWMRGRGLFVSRSALRGDGSTNLAGDLVQALAFRGLKLVEYGA
jgi:hypothetical protein